MANAGGINVLFASVQGLSAGFVEEEEVNDRIRLLHKRGRSDLIVRSAATRRR
jgi:hypothetical protein